MNTIATAFLRGFARSMGTSLATGIVNGLSANAPGGKKLQINLVYQGGYAADQFGTWIWANAGGQGWALDPQGNWVVANLAVLSLQPRSYFYSGSDGKYYMQTATRWYVYVSGAWQIA